MSKLVWGAVGNRFYEAGTDRGVLYVDGDDGVPWNGLISVNEASSGGNVLSYYLDGYKYLTLLSAEEFSATLTAFAAPREFAACDGTKSVANGLFVTQQPRKQFRLTWRTMVGNDEDGLDHGYKIHLVYGALASPSERANQTIADSISPINLSWQISTVAPRVAGIRPTAHFVVDTRFTPRYLIAQLEEILYGSDSMDPRMPDASELVTIFTQEAPLVTRNLAYAVDYEVNTDLVKVQDFESGQTLDGWVADTAETEVTPAEGYTWPEGGDWCLRVRGDYSFESPGGIARIKKTYSNLVVGNEYVVTSMFADGDANGQTGARIGVTGMSYGIALDPDFGGKVYPTYTFTATAASHEVLLEYTMVDGSSGYWDDVSFDGASNDTYASPGGDNGLSAMWDGTPTGVFRFGIEPGETYTAVATASVNGVQVDPIDLARKIVVYAAGGSSGTGTIIATSDPAPNVVGDHEVRLQFTVPADALSAWIRLYNGSAPGGVSILWSNFLLAEGEYDGSFFDGDTPSTVDVLYQWEGLPNASPSTKRAWEG